MFEQTLHLIQKNRERALSGKENCIPNPFPRLRKDWPGIEQGKYYGCTANSKVGKSQITDFLFLYHPITHTLIEKSNYDVNVLYFSLEMSKEQKTLQAMCYFLKKFHNIIISPKDLRSLNKALDDKLFNTVRDMKPFFDSYFEKVKYIDTVRNRYGIWLEILNYAKANGEILYEMRNYDGKETKVMSGYKPYNSDLITIIVVDHIGLLTPESGKDLYQSISELSSIDFVKARNIFNFSPVIVQQQMSSQESLEHKKADALMPSLAGLAENKTTQRDVDMFFGLFSPARHEIRTWKGYNIEKLQDNFRALEILASREGGGNIMTPLYFQGECSYFEELPLPNTIEYNQIIQSIA